MLYSIFFEKLMRLILRHERSTFGFLNILLNYSIKKLFVWTSSYGLIERKQFAFLKKVD